jgi:protease IV
MRDFFKHTLATLLGLFIFLGLGIGGLLSLVIMTAVRDPGPRVQNNSVLTLNLSTEITDARQGSGDALEAALSGDQTDTISLREVVSAIDHAAQDDRITALYVYGDADETGTAYATLKEVREALQRFRKTEKEVVAYDVDWGERSYYLASVANTIAINPFGSMQLNGLRSEGTFFAGALQKFGVDVQVTRVGKYKSAVEPFLLTKRSPENRQQTRDLLGDLWTEFLAAVGKERKLSPQQLQAIADNEGILEPTDALKRKLVTKVAYEDEMIEQLKKLGEEDENSFRQISIQSYARLAEGEINKGKSSNHKIAVLYAEGSIVNGEGGDGQIGGDSFAQQLRELRQDDDVKAVVLRINSPGGSATASEIIQREVILTRKAKPVVVSMGGVAASGGYWIATYSDRIFAEPNTITGSIGVFGLLPNIQKLANNNGITWDVVKTGKLADIQTLSRPKSDQEMAVYQKSVDRIYNQFLSKVAESRKLDKSKVAQIAQGRVWSGVRAKSLGLVDELGGLEIAIQDAAKRAKLEDNWQVEEFPKPRTLSEEILANLSGANLGANLLNQQKANDPVWKELQKLKSDLSILSTLNDPKGVYARLPINFRID